MTFPGIEPWSPGVIDSDTRRLNRLAIQVLNMNVSENINLNRHHLVSRSPCRCHSISRMLYFWISPKNTKLSYLFWNSNNLYQTILRGSNQFAPIFRSWNSILTKLLIYQYLYIYICHICYVPTLTLCHTVTKMIYSMFIRSNCINGTF